MKKFLHVFQKCSYFVISIILFLMGVLSLFAGDTLWLAIAFILAGFWSFNRFRQF